MRRALLIALTVLAAAAPAAADAAPTLSIADATVVEGSSGAVNLRFTITASEVSAAPVTVGYTTADGTAKAPGDYATTTNTATILPGQTTAGIDIPIVGDTTDEADETFTVQLSDPSGATIEDDTATGTITDDDAAPSLRVNDRTLGEGTATANALRFTITLSKASAKAVTVAYATNDGTASAVTDYEPVSGTLTFDPGQTSKAVDVRTRPDALDENTERFDLRLSNAINATIADGRGIGSITDDDASPSLRVADVRLREGTGVLSQFAVPVRLSAISGRSVTVRYATRDRTAHAGLDYSAVSGTATIPAGQATATILVPVFADRNDEPDRQFEVRLSSASGASIADSIGLVTIADDDTANRAPRITYLKFFPRAIVRHGVGSLRLVLSERARVAVRAQRLVPRRGARLAHWTTVRRIVVVRGPGSGKVRFLARTLPAGRYRFVVVARDRQGLASATRVTGFRIVRG